MLLISFFDFMSLRHIMSGYFEVTNITSVRLGIAYDSVRPIRVDSVIVQTLTRIGFATRYYWLGTPHVIDLNFKSCPTK